jgi:glycosyltransferase involved in cell wall biosynthesis
MDLHGKALYLSYDGLTDPLGQAQILPYLLGLENQGMGFVIISFEKKEAFLPNKQHVHKQLEGRDIQWIPLSYTKKPAVFSTVYDLWRMKRAASKSLTSAHTIIHCRSYLPMLVAMSIHQGRKVIFDMRGLWADERVEGNLWPQHKPLYRWIFRYFRRKEKEFVQQSDALVSLTQDGIKALSERYGSRILENKSTVIPCCVDSELFQPENPPLHLKRSLGIPEDGKVLIHVGSVGTWYRLDQELVFFNALSAQDPTWYFLILTKDTTAAAAIVNSNQSLSSRVVIHSAPHHEVPSFLNLAQASIQFIEPAFSKRASSPVKLGESLAMGVPVIGNAGIGDSQALIQEGLAGICISSWDDIPSAVADFQRMRFDSNAIREYAIKTLGLEQGIAAYQEVYTKILPYD